MNLASSERAKAKVRAAVAARGLVSVMSDTKWRELVSAVKNLPFAPAYQIKDVMADAPIPPSFEEDVWHTGDWVEGLLPYYSVEWIRVRPRMLKHPGRLVSPRVDDIEREFLAVLHEVGVPHRKRDACIQIFGYAESTVGLER